MKDKPTTTKKRSLVPTNTWETNIKRNDALFLREEEEKKDLYHFLFGFIKHRNKNDNDDIDHQLSRASYLSDKQQDLDTEKCADVTFYFPVSSCLC